MNNEIHEIELSIEEARKHVEIGRMAEKLASNREFKKIVLEGYFEKEAARLAQIYSDPMLPPDAREGVQRDLCGVGAFKRYLQHLVRIGTIAEQEIREQTDVLEELRAEEGEA